MDIDQIRNSKFIETNRLVDSPFQPRTEYSGIEDLAVSIQQMGILQPLLVRVPPRGDSLSGPYEIVAGHRRKRGAELAGLTMVPCIVSPLTDREAKEAILVENGQREDLSPMEEVDVYLLLVEDGMRPEEIAARTGKSETHIYRRLRLQHLCIEGREALRSGDLKIGIAELISGIADLDAQELAVSKLRKTDHSDPTISEARRFIEFECLMKLRLAVFDTSRPDLLADAGSCDECKDNTAVHTMLFPELSDDPRCTNSRCFQEKRDAYWDEACISAKERGLVVLDGEAGKKVVEHGHLSRKWIDLNTKVWSQSPSGKGSNRKWKTVLGKRRMPQIHLVRCPVTGGAIEVVKLSDAKKKASENPKDTDPRMISSAKAPHEIELENERLVSREFKKLLLEEAGVSLTKLALPGDLVLWQMLAVGISCRAWAATISAVAKRRGLVDKKSKMTNLEALLAFITREDPPPTIESLQMVVLELLAVPSIDDHGQVFLQHLFGNSGFFGYLNDVSSLAQIEDKARAVLGSTS